MSTRSTSPTNFAPFGYALVLAAILLASVTTIAEPREPVSGLHVDLRDLVNYPNHHYPKLAKILYADLVKRSKNVDLDSNSPTYFQYFAEYEPRGPHGDTFLKIPLSPAAKANLPPELRSQTALQNEFYNLPDEVPSDFANDLIAIGKPEDPEKPRIAFIHALSNLSRSAKIYSAQIESEPVVDDVNPDLVHVKLLTFVNLKSDYSDSFFQRFTVTVDLKAKKVIGIDPVGDEIKTASTNFTFTADLKSRKLIVLDENNDITIVYPLGVGGLDDGVTTVAHERRLMSPTIDEGFLIKASAQHMLQHCYPDYFNCRPFLPIFDNKNPKLGWTKLGLHGPITKNLLRGYVSHGCMRMREKDLYEATAILLGSSSATLPISILLDTKTDNIDHPMPLYNERYFSVVNAGTDDEPKVKLDEEGLTLTRAVHGEMIFDDISAWDRKKPGKQNPVIKKEPAQTQNAN